MERLINSQPLTILSEDPRDPIPLTPADFLLGSRDTIVAGVSGTLVRCNLKERWKLLAEFDQQTVEGISSNVIWGRLHAREKWPEKQDPIREGQVVVLLETHLSERPLAI